MKWSVVYEGAFNKDGSPYFPEKLDQEALLELRQSMGLYRFTNQYLNKVIPDEDQDFKKSWIKYYKEIPDNTYTFAFIDPAISLSDNADYTACIIVKVDADKNWYVTNAIRQRITATETMNFIFRVFETVKPMVIGIEDVAYQKALIHFVHEEMQRRQQFPNIRGIPRKASINVDGDKKANNSKNFRIRSLVPRFEFGKILLAQGLDDFILEYSSFPRGSHDDLLDALTSIDEIVFYPDKEKEVIDVRNPADPRYEKYFIRSITSGQKTKEFDE